MADITLFVFRVPPTAESVSRAHRRIATLARRWSVPLSDDALRDVQLCAAEVLTNALIHTASRSTVCGRWAGDRLRIEITDSLPGDLAAAAAARSEEHGRGLLLVESISAAWGSDPVGSGKVVWFEVAADKPVSGHRLTTLSRRPAGPLARPGALPRVLRVLAPA